MENFIQDNMILISGEHKQEIYNIISKCYVNRPVYFIKYCKEKAHAEDVLNGNLFIRNARAYKEIEEQTGERGTGDKNEMACRVPINVPFTITIGYQTFNIPIEEGREPSFVDSRDLDMLVYCLTWVDFPKINDIDIYENDNDIKWQSLYKLDNLDLNEYKYCVVIYGVEQFCLDFEKYVKAQNGVCFGGMVEYSNNIQQKFEDFTKMSARRFFYKDKYFENQSEFRIVTDIKEPQNNKIQLEHKVLGFILSIEDNKEIMLAGSIKKQSSK